MHKNPGMPEIWVAKEGPAHSLLITGLQFLFTRGGLRLKALLQSLSRGIILVSEAKQVEPSKESSAQWLCPQHFLKTLCKQKIARRVGTNFRRDNYPIIDPNHR